ncbi:MAG: aminoacyl-tRNA hydrolase [Phreatobacter sp.]|uniref:alternative ribosome rescue aminoacyl-tRNA hydrolase ArfB n=1 Tax=Phreatobacter sp. TaxID=1966341 RepID=UPI001A413496|nr:alternative ribosome rescue aminoacyl-tRNA hydrolase ArfB [Phreatobacter sp.]MBL8569246.1 aminoacyl-tRNA hydrolase [Phreatobacter sp.]
MIAVTPFLDLNPDDIAYNFVRSSGPGGQNVNKVATACELRFDLAGSALPPDVKARLVPLAGSRLTKDGVIVIQADRFRSQDMNREDALARLVEMVAKAAVRPKRRIATRPTRASKERRLEGKQKRSGVKKMRQGKPGMD